MFNVPIYKHNKIVYNNLKSMYGKPIRIQTRHTNIQEGKRMKNLHFRKLLCLAMALVLAGSMLAGCGSGTSSGSSSIPNNPASGGDSQSGGSQASGGQGTPAKDSLNVVTYADPVGVYPLHSDYSADKTRDGVFFQQVYDTLFRIDESGNPTPWLATDYEVSEDRRGRCIQLGDGCGREYARRDFHAERPCLRRGNRRHALQSGPLPCQPGVFEHALHADGRDHQQGLL